MTDGNDEARMRYWGYAYDFNERFKGVTIIAKTGGTLHIEGEKPASHGLDGSPAPVSPAIRVPVEDLADDAQRPLSRRTYKPGCWNDFDVRPHPDDWPHWLLVMELKTNAPKKRYPEATRDADAFLRELTEDN